MYPLDRELWDAARQGDAASFGILFDRHARAIYNFCFRRCGSWDVAEDLTSVVFLEAWRRRSIYLENESALPWLCGIAVNVTRSQRRSLRRYQAALSRLPAPDDALEEADDVVRREDDADRMRDVLAAIQQLPQREQGVPVLVAWEGCVLIETKTAREALPLLDSVEVEIEWRPDLKDEAYFGMVPDQYLDWFVAATSPMAHGKVLVYLTEADFSEGVAWWQSGCKN